MMRELLDDLKRDEGKRLKPYRCTAGKLTIGYGRNLDETGISEEEAEMMLVNDVNECMYSLDENIGWWRNLSENAQRGLLNMRFNLGMGGLLKFKKMLAALEKASGGDESQYAEAATQAMDSRWARQVVARAERIRDLFLS